MDRQIEWKQSTTFQEEEALKAKMKNEIEVFCAWFAEYVLFPWLLLLSWILTPINKVN